MKEERCKNIEKGNRMINRKAILISIVFMAFFFHLTGFAQVKTLIYSESRDDIPNPERGFYFPAAEPVGELSVEKLKKLRTVYSAKASADYSTWISLVYRGYLLTDFRDKPISSQFLEKLQKDFDAVRSAGLKIVLRFSYTDKSKNGDCPDKAICPPYGDAPKEVVLNHIAQLKPLIQQNSDVIAVVQEGFIGIWGENFYTDYFGDPSANGRGFVPDSSWNDRNEVLMALLDAVPQQRMVQVRTPQIRQRFLSGPNAPVSKKPSALKKAFDRSSTSRIAFHNDCFLASSDDYGTYTDYGNSSGRLQSTNLILRKYLEAESKYLAVGGETCDDTFSPQNDCEPYGHAMKEMAAMHYSFLNVSYNNLVNNDWEGQGCMIEIKKRLGYRIVLKQAKLPTAVKAGKKVKIDVQLKNTGFASPYNPRPVQLVLRDSKDGSIYRIELQTRIQKWYPGEVFLRESVRLPKEIKNGDYDLFLGMPDGYTSLQNRPEYSVRLANEGLWEESSGLNRLNHAMKVK
ncbi:DUF4832 domain-containing protein [Desertivirga arenae]|uniref:DUF4832 domain-containing protein n=1 Tax=Desertivirga arenae TaxID=2810309 RepID=UPI001A971E1A|nr:DUF4832 domain-containing protein [Pedobacter sp. SYSU D00823]